MLESMSDFSGSVHPVKDSIYFNSIYICISFVDWLHCCLKLYSKKHQNICLVYPRQVESTIHHHYTGVWHLKWDFQKASFHFSGQVTQLQSCTSASIWWECCSGFSGSFLRTREELWPPLLQLMAHQGKLKRKKFRGVQEVPRKGKIASIYVWIMLSALIKLVIDKKLFPKWGLIFYNESSVTGLGRSIGIILRLDSEYLLCENICFHIWQSWNFSWFPSPCIKEKT